MRQEVDRAKRKMETELQDVKEQLVERKAQVEELQIVLSKLNSCRLRLEICAMFEHNRNSQMA